MRWVSLGGCIFIRRRRRARPCGAVPRRVDVSRPQKLLAHSSSVSQRLGFEARSCYCVFFRRRARPCAAVRAHAPQFASMRFNARRLLVGPKYSTPGHSQSGKYR